MIAAMRLVLASSALLIITIDPSEPDRLVLLTYCALGLYVLYSVVLYVLAGRIDSGSEWFQDRAHWLDVAWYTVLVGLSSGTNSIFFFGFLFATLVASFRWGFGPGLRVAAASTVLFAVVAYVADSSRPIEINRFLLRPIYLLVLGYMMAYWGQYEILLRRRLALLKELSATASPRMGIGPIAASIMEKVRQFFAAEQVVLLFFDREANQYVLRKAQVDSPGSARRSETVPADLAQRMLFDPPTVAVLYEGSVLGRRFAGHGRITDPGGETSDVPSGSCEQIATLLGAESFVSIPLRYRGEVAGRGFVCSSRRAAFRASDVSFLLQLVDHVTPALENIRLVDQLASSAAEAERQRIARDIHDSVIQPYVGLQLAIGGVRQKLGGHGAAVTDELEKLARMAQSAIEDLRSYVGGLKRQEDHADGLVRAIEGFAAKFGEATGIRVEVEVDGELPVDSRLAPEIFQMVAEGLSNVRRHSRSVRAAIRLAARGGELSLLVENDVDGLPTPAFTPRSITERATSLGGRVEVRPSEEGRAVVDVRIPQ